MKDLEKEFWATRLDAKEAYKAWRSAKLSGSKEKRAELMQAYSAAWEKHQAANIAQFQWEAENG